MKENLLNDKSYRKSTMVRMKMRHELFEKNRQPTAVSYLQHYDQATREAIKQSIESPIPVSLPPVQFADCLTISYYRRTGIFVYKTRQSSEGPLDPHMTYQSLINLASREEIANMPNCKQVSEQFQKDLPEYLKIPYAQIRDVAAMVAGNHFLGKQPQILQIVQSDPKYLWVLVNHLYQRHISFKQLIPYMDKNEVMVYRLIFELTNNLQDEIIYTIISSEELVNKIIGNLQSPNEEVQTYAIRILGNILAEAEDYAGDLTKYKILDHVYPLLNSKNWQNRRDGCWLLSNYVFQPAAANQVLNKPIILQKVMMMYRNETRPQLRTELYYILSHLVMTGDKHATYKLAMGENLLEQCGRDLEEMDQNASLVILNLIEKLIELGDEYVDSESEYQEERVNPFIRYIQSSHIRLEIVSKTYSENSEISQISANIINKIGRDDNDYGMI